MLNNLQKILLSTTNPGEVLRVEKELMNLGIPYTKKVDNMSNLEYALIQPMTFLLVEERHYEESNQILTRSINHHIE
ncbi:hypothetical protein [Brevibacillus sp. DP1.3A]|uniref:hypothetical protein n=1 Tax=Brevibacillus sp. DP1.3A TaxID=2738867 RepID=UPI00156AB8C8|nr:hypothetical protein [Brevibacillus sp. DP1.3A]UED72206.1 hypothetical protein HP399_015665 [Brevibacillus sp. DP1.3A]